MLMAFAGMTTGNYFLQREFLEPLREIVASHIPALSSDDCQYDIGDHKPPKSSYSSLECLFSDGAAGCVSPVSCPHLYSEHPRMIQDVYSDIDIPPKIPHLPILAHLA